MAAHLQHVGLDPSADFTQSTEDLFLDLGESSPERKAPENAEASRVERRHSRIARAQRQSLPANSFSSPLARPASSGQTSSISRSNVASSLEQARYPRDLKTTNLPTFSSQHPTSSTPTRVPKTSHGAFSASQFRDREPNSEDRPTFRRRGSLAAGEQSYAPSARGLQSYKPSNLNYSSSRSQRAPSQVDPSESVINHVRAASRGEGTDSVDSAGAPSTVWDELDDLKSRIRKLEYPAKLPSTSGAAISEDFADRPRTATTTVTTVSSSPHRTRKPSISPSDSTTASTVHPLLNSALTRGKIVLPPNVYKALEAISSEALDLANLGSNGASQGVPPMPGQSNSMSGLLSERQVRRKADSLCRGITELCITLCEGKNEQVLSPVEGGAPLSNGTARPRAYRRGSSQPPTPSLPSSEYHDARAGQEPDEEYERNSPSRALQRIEARRSSLLTQGAGSVKVSREEPVPSATPTQNNTPSRFSRIGTSLRLRRSQNQQQDQDEEEDPTLRAPSRAMTDFGQLRSRTARAQPREYTSQHPLPERPLPDLPQRTPPATNESSLRRLTGGVPSALPQRSDRPSGIPATSTSFLREGTRRFLNRPSTNTGERASMAESTVSGSEERRRTLGQFGSPSDTSRLSIGVARTTSLNRRYRPSNLTVE